MAALAKSFPRPSALRRLIAPAVVTLLVASTTSALPASAAPPSVPQDLVVTVSRLGVAHLSWKAPATNSSAVTGYNVLVNGGEGPYGPIITTRTQTSLDLPNAFPKVSSVRWRVFALSALDPHPRIGSLAVTTPVGDPSGIYVAPPKKVVAGANFVASASVYWNWQHSIGGIWPNPLGTVTFSAKGRSCVASIVNGAASCTLPAPSTHGNFLLHAVYNGGPAEHSKHAFFYPSVPMSVTVTA